MAINPPYRTLTLQELYGISAMTSIKAEKGAVLDSVISTSATSIKPKIAPSSLIPSNAENSSGNGLIICSLVGLIVVIGGYIAYNRYQDRKEKSLALALSHEQTNPFLEKARLQKRKESSE